MENVTRAEKSLQFGDDGGVHGGARVQCNYKERGVAAQRLGNAGG
jgi:hypothetical protein